jgi:hypothetical protein
VQEDLTVKDTEEILEDLKNGKAPRAGPRYAIPFSFTVPRSKKRS